MRCLTLADALRESGWQCAFLSSAESEQIVPALRDRGFPVRSPQDAPKDADLLIVDHYGLDAAYEQSCRNWARKIMVIDDLANRQHDCDVLLDQTYGRKAEEYAGLVSSECLILTGAEYALLRPQFSAERQGSLFRRKNQEQESFRVLIFISSSDPENVTGKVLDGLDLVLNQKMVVDVVMGGGAPHLTEIRERVAGSCHAITLHVNVSNMAELMASADISIGAGGTTSWERCCLGLPTLLVEVADNQTRIAKELGHAGAVVFLGAAGEDLPRKVADFFNNTLPLHPEKLPDMVDAAASICDGAGVSRVTKILTGEVGAEI